MADSVASSLSYLDLDDPFNTTAVPKIPRPLSCQTEGPLDASQNLDLFGGIRSFGNALSRDDGGCFAVPPERDTSWHKIVNPPLDFSKLHAPYRDSAHVELPNKLFERTEELLSSDVTDDVNVSDDKLKSLVIMAARLLCEHDNLMSSRKKLIDSMEEMQQSERDAAIQLISELDVELVDEESRKLIQELSYALKLDIPFVVNGKNGLKPVAVISPSVNQNSFAPNPDCFSPSLFTVPPPDASRPPPGFGFDQTVPYMDMSRQMNTTPSDRQSPMLTGHSAHFHGLSNSAPNQSFNPPFPSMLDHPPAPINSSEPMFNQLLPPQPFYNAPPNGHRFVLPGRPRHQLPPPMMMQPVMPKVHLGPVTPVFNTGYRRRYSSGVDRRGRGRSGHALKK